MMNKISRRDFLKVSGLCCGAAALAACGSASSTAASSAAASTASSAAASSAASDAPVTLNFMFNGPENIKLYNDMIAEYEKSHPNVTIELTCLQNDYQTVLKTKINSGEIPDVFMSSAYNDNKVFQDYTYDLTDEDFVKQIQPSALAGVTLNGRITGLPLIIQGHSFIYNKDLFTKAGITDLPTTLDAYKDTCAKLQAAGIQPFSTGFAEWWVLPQTTYPSMSDAYDGDYDKLFADVQSGALKFGDLKQVDFALDLLDLINQNGGDKPMETTFDMQCSDFANGKAAMIHQGIWAEQSILGINPDIQMGFLQAPHMDGTGVLAVDANNCYRIAKDSPNLPAVLEFMKWFVTDDYMNTPEQNTQFRSVIGAPAPDTQLAAAMSDLINNGTTCPWWIFKGPDGTEQTLGTTWQNYVAGITDRDATKAALTKMFVDAYAAQ